ncbi:MAG: ABC transporter ATP-binding protein [Clostridia bacterium]|nr:ABC transporter ATP-binding protein [Clostridia bacterium]
MANDIILKCNSITKLYQQGETSIYALHNVNLEVRRGQFVMICGKSGSGKSTLLNMLAGFDTPTSGVITIDGVDINDAPEKEKCRIRNEKIGFVFQSYNLLPILTAYENIIAPMQIGKRPWSEAYFRQICERLGITDRLNHLPAELSGGECQRVAVARSLIGQPSVLFADEPTGNLDRKSSAELIGLLKMTNTEFGQTIVMVTHDETLLPLADVVYRMTDGEAKNVTGEY